MEAPEAIPRIRRFVLELAVRGRLVAQDPGARPSPELLARTTQETVPQDHLPVGWVRGSVGALLNFRYGKGLAETDRATEGPVPVFGSNGIIGFTTTALTDAPAVIVGRKGSAGALNISNGPSWTTDVAYYVEAPPFF